MSASTSDSVPVVLEESSVRMRRRSYTLATLLGGNYVNRFNLEGRSYQVIPQVPRGLLDEPVRLARDHEAVVGEAHVERLAAAPQRQHQPVGFGRRVRAAGYEIVPVNPRETVVDGLPCYPDLRSAVDATGPVDIVDVFRRADLCPAHAREAVEVGATCLWLQLGIASREAGRIALEGGLKVVMDRCTIIEVRRLAARARTDGT